jgi:hypothetical protein
MKMTRTLDKSHGGAANAYNKNWKPIHTSIVLDYAQGRTISQLCEKYGFASSTIANIVRSKKAKDILARIESNILRSGTESFPDAVKKGKILAFERMQQLLQNDTLAEKAPFAFFDKAAKSFELFAKYETPTPEAASVQNNNVQMNIFSNPEQVSALTDGLNKALEVTQRYAELSSGSVDGSSTEQQLFPERSGEVAGKLGAREDFSFEEAGED